MDPQKTALFPIPSRSGKAPLCQKDGGQKHEDRIPFLLPSFSPHFFDNSKAVCVFCAFRAAFSLYVCAPLFLTLACRSLSPFLCARSARKNLPALTIRSCARRSIARTNSAGSVTN